MHAYHSAIHSFVWICDAYFLFLRNNSNMFKSVLCLHISRKHVLYIQCIYVTYKILCAAGSEMVLPR